MPRFSSYGGGSKYLHVIPSTEGLTEGQILLIAIPVVLFVVYIAFRVWKSLRDEKKEAIRRRVRVRELLKKKPK